MNVISAIFALLGIVAFIVDLNLNGLYRSGFDYYSYLVLVSRGVPQLPHLGAIQPPGDPLPPFVPEPWGLFPGPPGEPRAGAAHPVGSGTLEVAKPWCPRRLSCRVWDQGEMGRGKPLALTCGEGSALLSLGSADGAFPTLELAGNGISIVLLIFTILEFCIAVATANFWCRATRLSSNELPQPPSYTEVTEGPAEGVPSPLRCWGSPPYP
uniref:Uncharacterized protein n=1 Tax=Anas platyrhynchos TaxID=8839 RepID=A0A8B9R428_ANAPL